MFALLRLFMRGRTELRENEALVVYIPKSLTEPLNWGEIFPRSAPIEIDLGCGDGAFLMAMAHANPEHNFLGIERLLGRVRKICRRVAREDLKNSACSESRLPMGYPTCCPMTRLRRFTSC